jgi:hypothetical protein
MKATRSPDRGKARKIARSFPELLLPLAILVSVAILLSMAVLLFAPKMAKGGISASVRIGPRDSFRVESIRKAAVEAQSNPGSNSFAVEKDARFVVIFAIPFFLSTIPSRETEEKP